MTIHGDTRIDDLLLMQSGWRVNARPRDLATPWARESVSRRDRCWNTPTKIAKNSYLMRIKGRIAMTNLHQFVKAATYSNEVTGDNEYEVHGAHLAHRQQVILDVNALEVKEHEFFSIALNDQSKRKLVGLWRRYAEPSGYTIYDWRPQHREYLKDEIEGACPIAWQNDNQAFYYIKKDPQTPLSSLAMS